MSSADIQQESPLLLRDCVTLRVIEYFAKSLKVIRNDTAGLEIVSGLVLLVLWLVVEERVGTGGRARISFLQFPDEVAYHL